MKKYNEILTDIESTKAAIQATKDEIRNLDFTQNALIKDSLRKNKELIKRYDNAIDAAHYRHETQILTLAYQEHNFRVAFTNEIFPSIHDVLKKYVGKQYGPKTQERIYDETKKATGYGLRICGLTSSCRIYDDGTNPQMFPVELCTGGGNNQVLVDNRIQDIDISAFYISSGYDNHYKISLGDYIDDIPARIARLKAAHAAAMKAQEELEKRVLEFNKMATGKITYLSSNHYIMPGRLI